MNTVERFTDALSRSYRVDRYGSGAGGGGFRA